MPISHSVDIICITESRYQDDRHDNVMASTEMPWKSWHTMTCMTVPRQPWWNDYQHEGMILGIAQIKSMMSLVICTYILNFDKIGIILHDACKGTWDASKSQAVLYYHANFCKTIQSQSQKLLFWRILYSFNAETFQIFYQNGGKKFPGTERVIMVL
jgi:hypothetical protein